jgi:hypothetical protein
LLLWGDAQLFATLSQLLFQRRDLILLGGSDGLDLLPLFGGQIQANPIIIISLSLLSVLSATAQTASCPVRILPEYTCTPQDTFGVLSATGIISKKRGLRIEFEEGMSQGSAVSSRDQKNYAWQREQMVGGQLVKLAMIKKGLKTDWEPDEPRNVEWGSILLVTFPLGGQPTHAINFKAEITSDDELVDALLMILTFTLDSELK